MKRNKIIFSILTFCLLLVGVHSGLAVEYPIISVGLNGGYAKSDLATGTNVRLFFRYSLEAYIPGFQIDLSYAKLFYGSIEDSFYVANPAQQEERELYKTTVSNSFPAITGAFHMRPFGGRMVIYAGGGAQFHFISATREIKERYWDPEVDKYQEREVETVDLLDNVKLGYHVLGGLRFLLGKFGSFDVEVRQTFLDVSADDWEEGFGKNRWGDKSWNNLSVSAGMTIYIF